MGICYSGMERKAQASTVLIKITEEHPLIQLAQTLQWKELSNLIISDLKKTPGGKWKVGRKLKLRVHLGVYLLQHIFNKTDRQIEYDVRDNAAYQIFCGRGVVEGWHVPDHTKIEKFRSRLSPETQKRLANQMAFHAVKLGLGGPEEFDIDSTIQEANMAYPADSGLLKKFGMMCKKAAGFLNKVVLGMNSPITVNMKKISAAARKYFFLPKNSTKDIKDKVLMSLLKIVSKETKKVINICEGMDLKKIREIPWNIKRTLLQIKESGRQYLKDVRLFLKQGAVVTTKRLSFHLKEVTCFTKGKLGKKYQFGRAFQLGRIKGNFFIVGKCTSTQMSDKTSMVAMVQEHEKLFGQEKIESVSTDKGYYSSKNEKFLFKKKVKEIGIQRPHNIKREHPLPLTKECQEKLINRRSGIEPLIGHVKQNGQLGRSRMKSDQTIESSGYTSVLGFNMRQIIRHQKEKGRKAA